MPKFDLKTWKEMCPEIAAKGPLNAVLKEWNIHCPEEEHYDDPSTDPRKLVTTATNMSKKLIAAIIATEKLIGKDRNKDPKAVEKKHKAVDTLAGWIDDSKKYVAEVTKWSQKTLREETEERKTLWKAQEHFVQMLVGGFEESMKKLAAPAKEFEAAFKARNLTVAAAKFEQHRKLVTEAAYHLRPISIAKVRDATAARFHVTINHLAVPGQFHALAAKVKKADDLDNDMQDRLDGALEDEANGVSEPDDSTSPAYRKAVREILAAYKNVVVKVKAKLPLASQYLQAASQIKAVPVADAAYQKTVLECRVLNEKAFIVKKEVHALLAHIRGPNSPLHKKFVDAGGTDADYKKTLLPQVNAALAHTRRLVGIDLQAARLLEEWLRAVAKAHPESKDATAELSHMTGKYNIRLI